MQPSASSLQRQQGISWSACDIADCPVQIVASDSPVEIRQAAAVTFKNTVKYRWVGADCLLSFIYNL